jgi:transposase
MDDPSDWKDLQVKITELFKNAGYNVQEDILVRGGKGSHKIDVFATFMRDQINYKIIVECKNWASRVKKEQVMTLASIVEDIGAEKGIIISKEGFQKGAYKAASQRNIDLFTFREFEDMINSGFITILDKLCSKCGEIVMDTTLTCPNCGNSLLRNIRSNKM